MRRRQVVSVSLARRWFWLLAGTAVLAAGGLYRALQAGSGPVTGLAVLLSATVVAAATVQAARILLALQVACPGRDGDRR